MTTAHLLLAALAAIIAGAGLLRGWLSRRALAKSEAARELADARAEQAAAERDRAQLQEAATASHAADQAHGHEAAGEIDIHATGHPDRDRAALYDRMRDAAHDRRAGAGAGPDPAVRPVPGADATRGPRAGD